MSLTSSFTSQYYEKLLLEARSRKEKSISEVVEKAVNSKLQEIQLNIERTIKEKKVVANTNESLIKEQEIWQKEVKEIEERERLTLRLKDEQLVDLEEQPFAAVVAATQAILDEQALQAHCYHREAALSLNVFTLGIKEERKKRQSGLLPRNKFQSELMVKEVKKESTFVACSFMTVLSEQGLDFGPFMNIRVGMMKSDPKNYVHSPATGTANELNVSEGYDNGAFPRCILALEVQAMVLLLNVRRRKPYDNVTQAYWERLCDWFETDKFKKFSTINKAIRAKKKVNHCGGSRSFLNHRADKTFAGVVPLRSQFHL
ncbi:hypothetical protein IFM89_011698 [Coptis chinensis]|uniref:Uncharacterized protein n=1 Tax=Coptis chinensis TaxID=261450 RepID=A0A835GYY9_9MAGN|nr:hypothetical protein IFM89_011698 [Coptis chinensis]